MTRSPSRDGLQQCLAVALAALLVAPWTLSEASGQPDALAEFLKRYGCNKVKGWALAQPNQLFKAWQHDVWSAEASGADQGVAASIAKRGNVGTALTQLPRIMSAIETMEEAAYGDSRKAAEILSKWVTSEAIATLGLWLGTGAIGAVWTVANELGGMADDLSREIAGLNVKAYSKMAAADPALLGPGGVDHYLNAYLNWNDLSPQTWKNWETIKRRAHLAEYAKYKLKNKNFPQFPQWHQNRRVVRAAASALLQDVGRIVEAQRRAERLQGQLRAHAAALRREVAVMQKFQGFVSMVKGVTCTDQVDEMLTKCAADIELVNQNLLRAATDAGNLPKIPRSAAQRIDDRITDLDRRVDHYETLLERSLEHLKDYCAQADESLKTAQQVRDQARSDATAADDAAARAESAANRACATESLSEARTQSTSAQNSALDALSAASAVRDAQVGVQQLAAPERVDFSDLRSAASSLEAEVIGLRNSVEEFREGRKRIMRDLASGETHLRSLLNKCAEGEAARKAAQLLIERKLAEFNAIRTSLNTPIPDADTLERLATDLATTSTRIAELEQRQADERACLAGTPDIRAIAWEIRGLGDGASKAQERAAAHAQRAQKCVTDLETHACSSDDECSGSQVCREGRCVDSERQQAQCETDADCPEGETCSQGSCIESSDYEAEEEVDGEEAEEVAKRAEEEDDRRRERDERAYKVGRGVGQVLGEILRGKIEEQAGRSSQGGSGGPSTGGGGQTPPPGSGDKPEPGRQGEASFSGTITGSWELPNCDVFITTEGEYEVRISAGGSVSGSMWNDLRGTWYDISGNVSGSGQLTATAQCRVVNESVCVQEIARCSFNGNVSAAPKLQGSGSLDCSYCRGSWSPIVYR